MKYATAMNVLATMREGVISSNDASELEGSPRVIYFKSGYMWREVLNKWSLLEPATTPTDRDLTARDWVYDKDPTGLREDGDWFRALPEDVQREGLSALADFTKRQNAAEREAKSEEAIQ